MRAKGLILVLILLLTSTATAEYIGTAPGLKDLGTVERGSTEKVDVYLLTDLEDPFTVNPSFQRPTSTVFSSEGSNYDFDPEEASRESIEDWIDFPRQSFAVDPTSSTTINLEGGGQANARGSFSFFLEVPEDAEPGYHAGAVNLNPKLNPDGSSGTSINTFGLTQFVFVFRVPGKATKNVKVLDVNSLRTEENSVRIDYLLKNNGTVTVNINRAKTKIYDSYGRESAEFVTGGMYLSPGESKVIKSWWRNRNVSGGDYRVESDLNYITGSALVDQTIDIPDVPVNIESTDEEDEDSGAPIWPLIMLVVLLGALMFYLDMDPFWIILILGIIGISGFILWANLSAAYIGILIILALGVIYYR